MHPLGEIPLTTNNVSFMKHPNQKCSCMGWKEVDNEQYAAEMAAIIILAPWTACKCARRSACGICWNWIQVLTDAAGPLSNLPQARWVLRPNTFPTLSRNREFARRGWLNSVSQVEGLSLIRNDLIPSHALMIPNKNLLDARSRLGVCTSFKNNHFREGDQTPPILGLDCISWFRNVPF